MEVKTKYRQLAEGREFPVPDKFQGIQLTRVADALEASILCIHVVSCLIRYGKIDGMLR